MISKITHVPSPVSLRLPAMYQYIGQCQNLRGCVCVFRTSAEGYVLIQGDENKLPDFIRTDCYMTQSWKRLNSDESVILTNED